MISTLYKSKLSIPLQANNLAIYLCQYHMHSSSCLSALNGWKGMSVRFLQKIMDSCYVPLHLSPFKLYSGWSPLPTKCTTKRCRHPFFHLDCRNHSIKIIQKRHDRMRKIRFSVTDSLSLCQSFSQFFTDFYKEDISHLSIFHFSAHSFCLS